MNAALAARFTSKRNQRVLGGMKEFLEQVQSGTRNLSHIRPLQVTSIQNMASDVIKMIDVLVSYHCPVVDEWIDQMNSRERSLEKDTKARYRFAINGLHGTKLNAIKEPSRYFQRLYASISGDDKLSVLANGPARETMETTRNVCYGVPSLINHMTQLFPSVCWRVMHMTTDINEQVKFRISVIFSNLLH